MQGRAKAPKTKEFPPQFSLRWPACHARYRVVDSGVVIEVGPGVHLFYWPEVNMADIKHLEATLSPVIEDHGMELVDLEFRAERAGWVLRLFVDRSGGVSLEDCARISRECSVVLDAEDLIERKYRLEVSSPGIERRLRRPEHFEQQLGRRVRVEMCEPVGGRRRVTGELAEVTSQGVRVDCPEGDSVTVAYENVKRANLKVF